MTLPPDPKVSPSTVGSAKADLPWSSWTCLVLAGLIVLFPLSCTWSFLSNYSFGWWVPLLTLILLFERWPRRPAPVPRSLQPNVWLVVIAWGILFLGLRLALEVSLVARPLVLLSALFYVGALLYWVWIYGGWAWLRYFAFPICFLLLSVPWLRQLEDPLVQGLAPFNASLVAHVLVDFGIFAHSTGQVIVLPNCTLGVKEACSGLRSIQAALMIAFLLGELYRFDWGRRLLLVFIALGMAMLGNVLRTLFLALVAAQSGVEAMEKWHDTAGGFILVFTSVTTLLICHLLHRFAPSASSSMGNKIATGTRSTQGVNALRFAGGILFAAIVAEAATQGWFAWKEMGTPGLPLWTAVMPTGDGAHEMKIDDETSDMLKYDGGRQVDWRNAEGWTWSTYWFLYHQKPWAVSAFTNHNPDKCLPAAGFLKVQDHEPFSALIKGMPLQIYPKEFSWEDHPVYVFWMVYANRPNFPLEEAVNPPNDGPVAKVLFYLTSIWKGNRGSTAETESLEVILAGPDDYDVAKAAYLAQLEKIVLPQTDSKTISQSPPAP